MPVRRWAATGEPTFVPPSPPEFELEARRLGLKPADYLSSGRLRNWIERNYQRKFVPEHLLQAMGLDGFEVSF